MESKELKAILDLGFCLKEKDGGCYAFGIESDPDVKITIDCTGLGEDGLVLHSEWYDDWRKEYVSYGLNVKELEAFLAFMKTLPKEE